MATSITERTNNKKRKAPKVRTRILKKHIVQAAESVQPSNEVRTVSATDENHHHNNNNNNNNKATQTVCIGKAIVAAKIETSVVRNSLLVEVPSGFSSSSCCNRMSFKFIHNDPEKCKYFCGLYPGQFDALFTFLGEAKFNLTYWNCANISNKGLRTRSSIQKFSLEEQLFITLLRLRRRFNLVTLAHLYDVCEFTIRKIFTTWIMFMFHHCKDHEVLMFPERNAFNKLFVPKVFRKFKNIRCIVDCTE